MEATATGSATDTPPNGDVPLDGEGEGEQEAPRTRVEIDGDGQLTLSVGGHRPTDSEVKIVGGSIGFNGSLSKGERVALVIHARVGEVSFIDKVDRQTGDVVQTTRRHKLRIEGATKIEGEE